MECSVIADRKRTTITISLITILLCLVSMVGVSYALFTAGDDGKIGINAAAAECDIDIVDENGVSLIGETLDFDPRDGRDIIYFEPGATFYTEGFKISNNGNIPVNYRLSISPDPNMDMTAFNDAFDFWITTDPEDPSAPVGLKDFDGMIQPGKTSDTYYLVVRMKPNVDNGFQNKIYSGIGVTVTAVQGNVDIDEVNE
jgi:hypothetical protein